MNCHTAGIVGIALLGATFFTMTVTDQQHEALRKTLSPELDATYTRIATKRRNLYMQGLLIGLFVAYCVAKLTKVTNAFHRVALVVATTLLVSVAYYSLMPKSEYMLQYLKTPEQNEAWLNVYKEMKGRYMIGFLLGAAAAVPIAYAMC
jgi:uncharacterized protein YacL